MDISKNLFKNSNATDLFILLYGEKSTAWSSRSEVLNPQAADQQILVHTGGGEWGLIYLMEESCPAELLDLQQTLHHEKTVVVAVLEILRVTFFL